MGTVGISGRAASAQRPAKSVDVLTPPSLLAEMGALRLVRGQYRLGRDPFALDPAASLRMPWPTARAMLTVHDDGMAQPWQGEVWCNPPYGLELYAWLARLADHGDGVALLYARTDTIGFQTHVWGRASAVYFFAGRIWFHEPITGRQRDQNAGGPCCLAVYGKRSLARVRRLLRKGGEYPGALVTL
jgi:hypothetical protein